MCFLIIIGIKGHAKAMKNIINKMIYRELSKHLRLLEGCKFKEKAGSCSIMKQPPASLFNLPLLLSRPKQLWHNIFGKASYYYAYLIDKSCDRGTRQANF
jgi:hypothetical protein